MSELNQTSTQATITQATITQLTITQLTITQPDDWHVHLRDGTALAAVVGATAAQFARAIVMPNLKPPVTTVAQAESYRLRIEAAVRAASSGQMGEAQTTTFQPLMTLYLTDATPASEIRAAKASGIVHGVKLYPSGATTNSEAGVSHVSKVYGALEAMQEQDLPLLVHGEVVDQSVDTFDREAVFIDTVMIPLRQRFPRLRVVFEHITTLQAAQYVTEVYLSGATNLGATITPQHLLYNRNAIFSGGLRPHWYCLPVLKREEHRLALVKAATSGLPAFFLGTDSAPHAAHLKEHAAACAGCYTSPHALELYATAFERANALDKLEPFASHYGPDFYKLARNQSRVTLKREPWKVPESIAFGEQQIVPLASGEVLDWKLQAR
jgi:dihydroorotase